MVFTIMIVDFENTILEINVISPDIVNIKHYPKDKKSPKE